MKVDENFIPLGNANTDYLWQIVINYTKHNIYRSKFKNKAQELKQILYNWKNYMDIEGYIAMRHNKVKTFLGKWAPIYKPLKDLKIFSKYIFLQCILYLFS